MAGGARPRWGALLVLVGFSITMFDATVVGVMLPHVAADLAVPEASATWIATSYLLGFAVPLAVTGSLGDRYGPRRLHICGLLLFALASVFCALSDSLGELTVARLIQGLGAAMVAPQAQAIITRHYPVAERAFPLSLMSMALAASSLGGPVIGGLVLAVSDWRMLFWINLPICALSIALALVFVPPIVGRPGSRSYGCLPLYFAGVGLFVGSLQLTAVLGWYALPVAFSGLLLTFLGWRVDNRSERPFVSRSLLSIPSLSLSSLAALAMGASLSVQILLEYLFFARVYGLSSLASSLLILPVTAVSMVTAPIVGRMLAKRSAAKLAVQGLVSMSVLLVVLAAMMHWTAPALAYVPLFALLGVAHGMIWSPMAVSSMEDVAEESAGEASGIYNQAMEIGSAVGAGVTAMALALISSDSAIALAFLAAPLLAAPGIFAMSRVARRRTVISR